MGNPVGEPKEVANEWNGDQKHQLELVILHYSKEELKPIWETILFVTYIILIPHDIEESIEGQIVVSTAKAGKRSKDASGEEHAMQVLLSIGQ